MSSAARDARLGVLVSELLDAGYVISSHIIGEAYEVSLSKRTVDETAFGKTLYDAISNALLKIKQAA